MTPSFMGGSVWFEAHVSTAAFKYSMFRSLSQHICVLKRVWWIQLNRKCSCVRPSVNLTLKWNKIWDIFRHHSTNTHSLWDFAVADLFLAGQTCSKEVRLKSYLSPQTTMSKSSFNAFCVSPLGEVNRCKSNWSLVNGVYCICLCVFPLPTNSNPN